MEYDGGRGDILTIATLTNTLLSAMLIFFLIFPLILTIIYFRALDGHVVNKVDFQFARST